MPVQPPSAVGPGAIMHPSALNASLTVGPGFGSGGHRAHDQYGELLPHAFSTSKHAAN
jgi:hypothetical protein